MSSGVPSGCRREGDISVIVPTLNEEQNLPRLLRSIRGQTCSPRDVVVVDQMSTDATAQIARSFACLVVQAPPADFYSPPARSRNIGARASRGRYLLHLDADMELPDPSFLERLVAMFDEEHRAVVIHEQDIAVGFWGQAKALERACYWGSPVEAARASTRELFDEVGGYDETISSGEDFLISDRYSERTTLASGDDVWLFHHSGRQALRRLLKKKFDYGRTAAAYLNRGAAPHRGRPMPYVGTCLRSFARQPGRLVRAPVHAAAMLLLRGLELGAVVLGMLVQKLVDLRRSEARSATGEPGRESV